MKHSYRLTPLLALVLSPWLFMAACEDQLIDPNLSNTPTGNFNAFWQTFDTHYGLFEVKGINWDALRDAALPSINDTMSDAQLYEVLTGMMVKLNDNHLNLYPTSGGLEVFPGGVLRYHNDQLTILKVQEDYDIEVVKSYVPDYQLVAPHLGFGHLADGIGYLNVSGTDNRKSAEKGMDKIIHALSDTRGMIVDARGHYGGYDAIMQYIASRFASSKKLYMTSRKRNGPSHHDFTDTVEWFIEPVGVSYTKPVMLLTSRFTQSAGETFTLAMKQLDQVTVLGDTTAGSFSDNPNFELPNGWIFSVSVGDYRGPDGKSYEGFGCAPDIWIRNSKEDLLASKDRTLEKAMELIK